MKDKFKLLPSIMCINWLNAESDLKKISPFVNYFHWDLVDGYFAPDFTMGSSIIDTVKSATKLQEHYHLMVEEPMRIFYRFKIDRVSKTV